MLRVIYIIISIIAVLYVLIKKRRFDFFSISVFSTVAYCYPAYLGTIIINDRYVPIDEKVYLCLIIHIIILLFWICLYDLTKRKSERVYSNNVINDVRSNYAVLVVSFLGILLMFCTIKTYGGFSGRPFAKNELLKQASKITEYFKYISLFVFVYAFTNTGKYVKVLRIIALVLVGYTFLLGHRSFAVIGIVAVAVKIFSNPQKEVAMIRVLGQHKIVTLAIILAAVFFFFVKNVFSAFMDGNYSLVINQLSNKNYYLDMLLTAEPNIIMTNLQYACQTDMGYSLFDYCMGFFSLIPLIGGRIVNIFDVNMFETLLNENFNPYYSQGYGIGSTIMGEFYSIGSYVFLVIGFIAVFLLISYFSKIIVRTKSSIVCTWLLISCVYFSFYIFRNSEIFLFVTMRAYFYIVVLCWIIKKFLPRIVIRK